MNNEGVCPPCVAGAAAPNSGLGADEVEGVDSAGFAPPKRPPEGGAAAGVDPNNGLLAVDVAGAPPPNRPPLAGGCD